MLFQPHLLAQTFFTPGNPFKDNLPSWTKFPLKKFSGQLIYSTGVIMDNYLIVLAQEKKSQSHTFREFGAKEKFETTLLAFSFLDHSVQEVEMDAPSLILRQDLGEKQLGSFLKYGENQIIKYSNDSVTFITIESFEPLKVKCEEMKKDEDTKKFSIYTAQIYKDCLYVYGEIERESKIFLIKKPRIELQSFDLKNHTWKSYETTGEAPTQIHDAPHSFIYKDNLCVYGVVGKSSERVPIFAMKPDFKHIFMLNLNSLELTKIEQQEKYLEPRNEKNELRPCGAIYKDHLVTLRQPINSEKNILCFLNLHAKNTWSTFDIEGIYENLATSSSLTGGLMIFKNSALSLATSESDKNLFVAMLNLSNFGISAPKSAEEEYLSGLFMSQEKSDVALKVEEKTIPAHKEILMLKSKYFAGLFSSGMTESKQDVIEINDCEYDIFKECLQFMYQEKVNFNNESQVIKLYVLADKYLQGDLCEKCLNYLISIVSMENIYTILDFAHQENLSQLKDSCSKCFTNQLTIENVSVLIKYLESKEDSEEFKEFIDQAFKFVLYHFFEIENKEKESLKICEDFILKNIGMETISALAIFLAASHQLPEDKKKNFEEISVRIREATFDFVQENVNTVMTSKIAQSFSAGFFTDYILYSASGKKRIEPGFEEEGNQELEKTKKTDLADRN